MRTHSLWVHRLDANTIVSRDNASKYMLLCLPFRSLQCLARYRLGGQHLMGRRHGAGSRDCKLCSAGSSCRPIWKQRLLARHGHAQEDLLHFMLECPAFDHIREHFSHLFGGHASLPAAQRMLLLFDHSDQSTLVKCVGQMDMYRCHLLGLRCPDTCKIVHQPDSYIPSDVLLRCQQDNGQPFARWCGPWLALIIVVVAVVLCLSWYRWDDQTW